MIIVWNCEYEGRTRPGFRIESEPVAVVPGNYRLLSKAPTAIQVASPDDPGLPPSYVITADGWYPLWGDGEHDDTGALQAAIDHSLTIHHVGEHRHRVSSTITLPRDGRRLRLGDEA